LPPLRPALHHDKLADGFVNIDIKDGDGNWMRLCGGAIRRKDSAAHAELIDLLMVDPTLAEHLGDEGVRFSFKAANGSTRSFALVAKSPKTPVAPTAPEATPAPAETPAGDAPQAA